MTVENKSTEFNVRHGNENLIRITKSADEKLINLIEREQSGSLLRIKIVGGGCNGLSYKMNFTDDTKQGDILVQTMRSQLLIDPKTALYIKGTSLDYSHNLVGGGFQFNNPNAKASCSCGESFSL
ncbi:MAG: HesB/IscA family protein [Coraliomargaritaceae bacterium]|jgi:iron-sulfur cluster assembly protein